MHGRQLSFLPKPPIEHGGSLVEGKRKGVRPVDPKSTHHIVMRSSRARGEWSMLHPKHRKNVDECAQAIAKRHGIKLYRYVNVGNHLHLLVKTPSKKAFHAFLRDLAGTIAIVVTGARKCIPLEGRFWDQRVYSKIVSWGREFKNLEQYFIKNMFEAAGLLSRKAKAAGLRVIPIVGWAAPP